MNKHLIGGGMMVGVVSLMAVLFLQQETAEAPAPYTTEEVVTNEETVSTSSAASVATTTSPVEVPAPKLTTTPQPNTFSGTLTEVNTGCFADGECYVVVDGKHVTVTIGRKQEPLGSIVGAPSIGDLESYIGEMATVYAKKLADGTYTLYGNEAYYLAVTPKMTKGCVVGGCSSQLCVEEGQDAVTTCEWTEKYSCYQQATCERQASGQCGWTETPVLLQCLAETNTATSLIQ
jgi:hypothetical protein